MASKLVYEGAGWLLKQIKEHGFWIGLSTGAGLGYSNVEANCSECADAIYRRKYVPPSDININASGVLSHATAAMWTGITTSVNLTYATAFTVGLWITSQVFSVGCLIRNPDNGNIYKCTTGGTSNSSGNGPQGTGTGISDGTCVWDYFDTSANAAKLIGYHDITSTALTANDVLTEIMTIQLQ